MAHLLKTFKPSRSNAPISFLIKNLWNIPKEIVEASLQEYFIQKLTKNTYEEKFNQTQGTIEFNGIPYLVIHPNSAPLNPKYPSVIASFRREKGYPFGYVLIKDFKS